MWNWSATRFFNPFVLEYAPLDQRYREIIQRLQKIPALMQQGEANLVDAPEVWNRVAREENDGNLDLIDKTLRAQGARSLEGGLRSGRRTGAGCIARVHQIPEGRSVEEDQRLAARQREIRSEVRLHAGFRERSRNKCWPKPKLR